MKLRRCVAAYIDQMIVASIVLIPFDIFCRFNVIMVFSHFYEMLFICFILVITKDLLFRNQSFGKKCAGLEILNEDNSVPRVSTLILRNIFVLLWPIDVILVFICNRKIGDMLFKTKISSLY